MEIDEGFRLVSPIQHSNTFFIVVKTVALVIAFGIAAANITIGSLYFHECPAQPLIAIYLIVFGIMTACLAVTCYVLRCFSTEYDRIAQSAQIAWGRVKMMHYVGKGLLAAWVVAGCVFVFMVRKPNYNDVTSPLYCHQVLFMFAFCLNNVILIMSCIGIVITFCICVHVRK